VTLGWLYKAIRDYHRQDDLVAEISCIANITASNFSLVPIRSTITSPEGQKVIYNSLKIETTKQDAEETQEALTKAFFGDQSNFIITKSMHFIPHKPTQHISQDQLQKYTICQNRYCTESTHTRVHGIQDVDTNLTTAEGHQLTIRQYLLRATLPLSNKSLFVAVKNQPTIAFS
jgi:hypothetical protein